MRIKRLEVGHLLTNSYIAGDKGECVIVDPGAEGDTILLEVASMGMRVTYIFVTHAHIDHIGALKLVKERTGAKIALHRDENLMLKTAPVQAPFFGLKPFIPPSPDIYTEEDDTFEVGGHKVRVLHVPGHSPGHLCFLFEENPPIIFVGDTLFMGSIGRTDLPGGSMKKLLEGIRKKILALPDETVVYPGHGPPTTIGREKKINPFLV